MAVKTEREREREKNLPRTELEGQVPNLQYKGTITRSRCIQRHAQGLRILVLKEILKDENNEMDNHLNLSTS